MAGAIALVSSIECSTCKSAPSVRSYDCHLSEKYAVVLIVLLSVRNTHAQYGCACTFIPYVIKRILPGFFFFVLKKTEYASEVEFPL